MAKKNKTQKFEFQNLKLLKDLYMVYSPSGNEKRMRKFIKDYIKRVVPDASLYVDFDNIGNIYVTKGKSDTYPVVVAHIDEVHHRPNGLHVMINDDKTIICGRDGNMDKQGIGADDKNGIWAALELLKEIDAIKLCFFVSEEVGCVGSRHCNMSFFDDARFVLQTDRRGGSDFIYHTNSTEVHSEEWRNSLPLKKYGFSPAIGSLTDVGELKCRGLKVCCVNISSGYYHAHTDDETTNLVELQNTHDFMLEICREHTDVAPHEFKGKTYSSYGGYGRCFGLDTFDDWHWPHHRPTNTNVNTQPTTVGNTNIPTVSVESDDFEDKYNEEYTDLYNKMENWLTLCDGEVSTEDIKSFYNENSNELEFLTTRDFSEIFELIAGYSILNIIASDADEEPHDAALVGSCLS